MDDAEKRNSFGDCVAAEDDKAASQLEPASGELKLTDAALEQENPDASPQGNDISLREVEPVHVKVRNLSVSVDTSPSALETLGAGFAGKRKRAKEDHGKTILEDVSADMPSGSLTAILGGSGSGKTTTLNVLAQRMHGRRLDVSGSVLFNGHEDLEAIRSAYVMQQDVLIPTLTIRETLRYSADLRLPTSVPKEERYRVVEEVILELGLKEAADTRIGNSAHKGCSGGEKRRTSIGVQLLANPSVLFLDEPTTGLDATSAYQLVRTLKNLARKGRTIITTIHQPRSEIWNLFDNLILLTRGKPAYAGPVEVCLPYFAQIGYELPPFVNPAEHLIDIVSVDTRSDELEQASSARVAQITQSWRDFYAESHQDETVPQTTSSISHRRRPAVLSSGYHTAVWRQTRVLTARTWIVTLRDPMGMFGSIVEAIALSIITGWIFYQLGGDQAGIRSRQGALYTASALQGYLILLYETYRLTVDIQVFDRERGEGVVGVPAFLLSRRIARAFIEDIPVPLIFSLIFYFMAGFRANGDQFLTFFSVILLEQYIAVCFAMLCIAVSRDFGGASLVANLAYTLQSMACGYFIQSNTIPIYVRWTKWIAYVFYAFGALCANEFVGHFYDCPSGGPEDPACKEYRGDFIMDSLGLPGDWVWRPILALLGFAIAFYLGAAFLLRFWKVEMQISRARASDSDASAGKEKMAVRSKDEVRTVTIQLDNYTLNIDRRKWWGKSLNSLSILKPVTANLEPGVLNVIMGPSGSGKTSLLNSMAGRLRDDLTTKYHRAGQMLFNGALPSQPVVQSICSFVTQDDDALLASLTVRETLRFAAGLRLPSWMSKEEKDQRAEAVLLKMGLKDCADNLIGNELVKGISGGEKRRVTIAVQILTEPRVLLLDEPTSGLDAFTASSIIDVLQGLTEEGRTIILTIHQSRSDLFHSFGNILLLARGGYPVYAGPGTKMLAYFASAGYECPRTTNPADFALDLITVDLQQDAREAESREKVRHLITSWTNRKITRPAQQSQIATSAELGSLQRSPAKFQTAFPILVRRAMINFWRQPPLMIARIMQVVGLGIVVALYFAPLKHDYYSVQNRLGFVQELAPIYFVGMLQNVAIYPFEKEVFYREYDDLAYSVEAFFLQYTSIEIPFEIITSLLFAVLADLAVGLPRTAKMYFLVAYNTFCVVSCGESLGILFNTLFEHTGFAVNVTSVFLSVAQIMGGIMSLHIPAFLQAFNHLSPVKWSVGNLAPYSLKGITFTCTDAQRLANGQCPIETGEQVLKLYNLDTNAPMNVMALGICAIVYRIIAYLVLKADRERWIRRVWELRRWGGRRRAPAS